MSSNKQIIPFVDAGMDTDSDGRYVQPGMGRQNRNILVGEDETGGLITNMLGCNRTVDVSEHELYLSRCYKVIGSYYNRLTREVYYFIFSQPYEIASAGASTSTSTTTTTTTTTTDDGSGLAIDYTSGSFLYDNMLLRYWEDTQTLDVIFRDTHNWFGLHYNYPMRDIVMIGDWLYFNPRVSEPKMIDVTRAYNYTNYDAYDITSGYNYGDYVTYYGGLFRANRNGIVAGQTPVTNVTFWDRIGDCYQNETELNFDSEFRYAFNVIKQPPAIRPKIAYGTDTSIYSNSVRGKMFRFAYRFKYFDNSYSVYSAYSDVSKPTDDETWNGEILNDINTNNFIAITVELHSAALVKSVEIVFQIVGEDWRQCKVVNRQEQGELTTGNFTYNFYNNEAYEVFAADTTVIKVQDSVPKLANAQEIINKNILCYGTVTEGFTNIPKQDINVTLTPESEALPTVYDVTATLRDNVVSGDISTTSVYDSEEGWIYYTIIDVSNYVVWGVAAGSVYRIVVNGTEGIVTLVAGNVVSTTALVTAMANAVHGSFIWADISHGATGDLYIGSLTAEPEVTVSLFYTPSANATKLSKWGGFKTGAFHAFCQFYYDESFRRWDAQTSKRSYNSVGYTYAGTTVYVPMFNEMSPVLDENNRWVINWTVNHLPPAGAKYWRWGYAGNTLCSYFVQYLIEGMSTADGMNAINITPLQELKDASAGRNSFPQSIIDAYEWQKGDRIRFLTQHANPGAGGGVGNFVGAIYDYEIIKQSEDGLTIYTQEFDYVTFGLSIPAGEHELVEIYRPIKETTKEVFYEFGELLPIIEDSLGVKTHGGTTTNQDTGTVTVASGTFDEGDVYHILRCPSKPLLTATHDLTAFHESQWYSDFYDSDDWDKGKTGVEADFGERKLNIIRFSNTYLQNTEINGLPTFEPENYKELNDVFGEIIAIYEIGDTLKCYQERKASSIQLGRVERTDETGRVYISASSDVLGSVRYSPSNYSTVFPESIARNNRFIYGFDIYNGVMWRDSVNGLFPISGRYIEMGADADYKMSTWFKDKAKALLVSGIKHCDVMSVWDEEFKNLHVCFVDYDEALNNETIVFHEPSNKWICFQDLDQTPESYNVMVELTYDIVKGFEGGLGYSFDEETRFALFNIVTGGGANEEIDLLSLTLTILEPTVQIDSNSSADLQTMSFTIQEPTVDLSWVHNDSLNDLFTWTSDQYGVSAGQTITWDIPKGSATVSSIPSWLTILDGTLHYIPEGGTVSDGEVMTIYPTSANTNGDKVDSFILTDSIGNTCTISVTHYATAVSPVVTIIPGTAETFTILTQSYTANLGSTSLYIYFTHDFDGNEYKDLTVTDASLNVLYAGTGVTGGILVRVAHASSKTMTLSRALVSGDILQVKIGLD